MNILCIILARGGSTRIPGKNIKILGGKPLIAYTIECAKHCTHQMRVVVSTDDPAIAAVAVKHGAEAPFLRPAAISQGDSLEIDAFKHALGWLKMFDQYEPDLIVKLFPTSPFRKPASVDKAIELLLADQDATCVRSVTKCSEHPFKMWRVYENRLYPLIPSMIDRPKDAHMLAYQSLPTVYVQNASIDVLRTSNVWLLNTITGDDIIPLVMDEDESIDINTQNDWLLAEAMLLARKSE